MPSTRRESFTFVLLNVNQTPNDQLPAWQLHLILPPLKDLRTIVEHMQRLSDVVAISATHRGELVLAIQTDDVRVSTGWEGCLRPTIGTHKLFD